MIELLTKLLPEDKHTTITGTGSRFDGYEAKGMKLLIADEFSGNICRSLALKMVEGKPFLIEGKGTNKEEIDFSEICIVFIGNTNDWIDDIMRIRVDEYQFETLENPDTTIEEEMSQYEVPLVLFYLADPFIDGNLFFVNDEFQDHITKWERS